MQIRDACVCLVMIGLTLPNAFSNVAAEDPDTVVRTLSVRVHDGEGRAVSGAQISRSVWTDQKDFDRNEKFVTDSDGIAQVTLPDSMHPHLEDIRSFASGVVDAGFTDVVLLGMGDRFEIWNETVLNQKRIEEEHTLDGAVSEEMDRLVL